MSTSVKVLLLVENNPYPYDFRVYREARALRNAGFDVSVIAPRKAMQPLREDIDGINVYRFPAPPGGVGIFGYVVEFGYATLAMFLIAVWIAVSRGIDVIHAANPPDTLCVIGAAFKVFGKRYVFDQHDLSPEIYLSRFSRPHKNFVYHILRFIERCSYKIADVVIATNESYKKLAIKRGYKDINKVFVVRNGPPFSYRLIESDFVIPKRAKYLIGYIGTIGPQDGVDYWLRAIREMVFTLGRSDFLSIIIGDGDAFDKVKALAKDLKIDSYVLFTGRLSELEARKYLSAVNVCVQPDPLSPLNDISTMNKLMEYMALGKPMVAFDLVETRYSAQDAALYVKPNNEREFAERVSWLLDNPSEGKKMGDIGRQRVANELAWEYSVSKLILAYSEGLKMRQSA